MIKNMKNFWKFRFTLFNDRVDNFLDSILNRKLIIGIKEIDKIDGHYITIIFNDNTRMVAWNSNKWYAWLSQGLIGNYTWKDGRPRRKTMRKLYNQILDII